MVLFCDGVQPCRNGDGFLYSVVAMFSTVFQWVKLDHNYKVIAFLWFDCVWAGWNREFPILHGALLQAQADGVTDHFTCFF